MLRASFKKINFCKNSTVACTQKRLISNTTVATEPLTESIQEDGVRTISLNQPKKCNPLSMDMMECLNAAVNENLDDKHLRCIILKAKGPIWSAGHDLKELAASTPNQQLAIFNKLTEIILNIQKAPVPVIARVNGLAAAAGCQLVSSCDMVVATDKSKFSTPGAKFGIFCSTPGVALARAMNSRSKAAYMLMTSLPISAQEAYETGLVTRLVSEAEIDEELNQIVAAIKSQSRTVVAFGKQFFYKQIEMGNLNDAYNAASQIMVDNLQMPDGREGLDSFKQKRKPAWKHA